MKSNTTSGSHLPHLDGLRACAAIFVLIHHAYLQAYPADSSLYQPPSDLTGFLLSTFLHGRYAVDLFIVLSGYCLMLPVLKSGELRGGAIDFFMRRAKRILPPYYLAMGLSLLLIVFLIHDKTGSHWDISIPVTTRSIGSHLLLLHDAIGEDFTINHVFWSIAVEWRIYFLFPLLILIWKRWGAVGTTLFGLGTSFLLYKMLDKMFGVTLTVNYIGLFVLGMFATFVAHDKTPAAEKWRKAPWQWLLAAGTVIALAATTLQVLGRVFLMNEHLDYLIGGWAAALLIALSIPTNPLHKVLSERHVTQIGLFAYSIYLIHAPLLQVLWQYPFAPLQDKPLTMFFALVFVGTPLILGISYLFYLCCERPFIPVRKPKEVLSSGAADAQ